MISEIPRSLSDVIVQLVANLEVKGRKLLRRQILIGNRCEVGTNKKEPKLQSADATARAQP